MIDGRTRKPAVVERAGRFREGGYGISLYPFGSAVLHGIGACPGFAAASATVKTYEIAGRGRDAAARYMPARWMIGSILAAMRERA